MRALRLAAILVGAGLASVTGIGASDALGLGGEAVELESARANARAGGPVSERDAELLRKYGCLSGTNNDFCRKLEHRSEEKPRRRSRRLEQ